MSGASVPIALPNPTTVSSVIAQVGVTQLPGDASGVKIPSISGLAGWEVYETGSGIARVRLFDGTGTGGVELMDINLQQNGVSAAQPPANPVEVFSGSIFLSVTGSIAGVIYILT